MVKRGPSRLVLQANIGPLGLGVSLAEEEGKVRTSGGYYSLHSSVCV